LSSPERYRRGAHAILDAQYHFVWKTKYGYKVLSNEIAQRLKSIIQEICGRYDMSVKQGNIRSDHIHILISAPSYMSISKMAQVLKGKSSYILQREFPELKKRYWGQHLWARGYFCATVGVVTEEIIKKYISEQNDEDSFKIWDQDLSA
jgi:putative transposase